MSLKRSLLAVDANLANFTQLDVKVPVTIVLLYLSYCNVNVSVYFLCLLL